MAWVRAGLVLTAVALGCGKEDAGDTSASVSLSGLVLSADDGSPVVGARVEDAEGKNAVTDSKGRFALKRSRTASRVSIVDADHASSQKAVPDTDAYLEVSVKNVDDQKTFDASKGAALSSSRGTKVSIPQNGLATSKGEAPEGKVTARLATIDPTKPREVSAMPGEGRARSGKARGQLSVHGALDLSAEDEKRAPLTVSEGKNVEADFPAMAGGKDEVDVFSYDTKAGEWKKEGTAKKSADGTSYRAQITHLSWWAVGELIDELSCVRGCVTEDGKPAPSARVTLVGIDYTTVLSTFADEDGCFAVDVKAGGQLAVSAVTESGFSDTKGITASTTQQTVDAGASACKDIGELAIGPVGGDEDDTDVTRLSTADVEALCDWWTQRTSQLSCEQIVLTFKDEMAAANCVESAQVCEQEREAGKLDFADCDPTDVQQSFRNCSPGLGVGEFKTCMESFFVSTAARSCDNPDAGAEPACFASISTKCPELFDGDGGQSSGGGPVAMQTCPLGEWTTTVTGDLTCDGTTGTITFLIEQPAGQQNGQLTVVQQLDNVQAGPQCGSTRMGTATLAAGVLNMDFIDDDNGCQKHNLSTFTLDASCTTMSTDGMATRTNCGACDLGQCTGCGDVSCEQSFGAGSFTRR